MKIKILATVIALAFTTAGFSQSTDSTGAMSKSRSKTYTHSTMHKSHARKNRVGAGVTNTPGNSPGSNGHVTSNGTNGLDRTRGNGTWDSTGKSKKHGMKMRNKSMMKKSTTTSPQ